MARVVQCQMKKLKIFSSLAGINHPQICNSRFHNSPSHQQPFRIANNNSVTSNCVGLFQKNSKTFQITNRNFSTEPANDESKKTLPMLMEFPNLVWPSVFKTIKNWIMVNFIVKPYFDQEFTMTDFVEGTKHALHVISANLAAGDLAALKGLVSKDALSQLQSSVSKMSVAQRNEIRVIKGDIYLTFPYQVGIMFEENENEIQKRWVEITMVFHVLRGLQDMQDRGEAPPINVGLLPEYQDKISICNYRFIKEFTQGVESDWTVNLVNQFKPADYIRN